MSTHPNAGKPAPKDILIDVSRLEAAFYEGKPDPADPNQLVSFGTSGHRGTSLNATFTEAHILAITQAICEYRRSQGITGPLTFDGPERISLPEMSCGIAEFWLAVGTDFLIKSESSEPSAVYKGVRVPMA
jgi:phosphoglucomutase